jgi:hypothetical protein
MGKDDTADLEICCDNPHSSSVSQKKNSVLQHPDSKKHFPIIHLQNDSRGRRYQFFVLERLPYLALLEENKTRKLKLGYTSHLGTGKLIVFDEPALRPCCQESSTLATTSTCSVSFIENGCYLLPVY